MKIDTLFIKSFQCYGMDGVNIDVADEVTTCIGANGAGKTAVFAALSKMFGLGSPQRTLRKSDFHLPLDESDLPADSELHIECVFSFPELTADEAGPAIPEFWNQMSANEVGGDLKARVALKATWVDDGTPDGIVETSMRWIPRLDDEYEWDRCKPVTAIQRSSVQVVYVPANRGSVSQVKALLRGRLWRAAKWSDDLIDITKTQADTVQDQFASEGPTQFIQERLQQRWGQINAAGTETQPILRLTEDKFEAIIRNTDVKFAPDAAGSDRELERLSDGQKSLFQIALTAATLEVEQAALAADDEESHFDHAHLRHVPLTLLLIEEPENSLSPFFLSRIMDLCQDIGEMDAAQVMVSSHSASILSRTEPETLRYFRVQPNTGAGSVRALTLPDKASEAGKYVRQAVRAYPELYFARLVLLGEGDSEQIVLPELAVARGTHLDKAFCPIVPLGGRHVEHFWTLLRDLDIPHLTLLDLDYGRQHGGAGAIQGIVKKLQDFGVDLSECEHIKDDSLDPGDIDDLTDDDIDISYDSKDETFHAGNAWLEALRDVGVFFSEPLDLDFSMLWEYGDAYRQPPEGGTGPSKKAEIVEKRKRTTLKKNGHQDYYDSSWNDLFRWYPYLFLSKSKPATHLTALNRISKKDLKEPPTELDVLLDTIDEVLG